MVKISYAMIYPSCAFYPHVETIIWKNSKRKRQNGLIKLMYVTRRTKHTFYYHTPQSLYSTCNLSISVFFFLSLVYLYLQISLITSQHSYILKRRIQIGRVTIFPCHVIIVESIQAHTKEYDLKIDGFYILNMIRNHFSIFLSNLTWAKIKIGLFVISYYLIW